jgi:phospholipase/carboxylesterase
MNHQTHGSEGKMLDQEVDDLSALMPALLRALDALEFISRYIGAHDLGQMVAATADADEAVREIRPRLDDWSTPGLAEVRTLLSTATDQVLTGFDRLREASGGRDDMGGAYRALRAIPRALEALYPMAADVEPINRFFLDPMPDAPVDRPAPSDADTGVFHAQNEYRQRGGYSLYVPETYRPDTPAALVVALHGGAGHGRGFLWSWIRAARRHGAVLAAPTSLGTTWNFQDSDAEALRLGQLVAQVESHWSVDPTRRMLTGMSDGATFAYLAGLGAGSPFTHLAPIASGFAPFFVAMADAERLHGLPIHVAHGALDWMFPVADARATAEALTQAGAAVTYCEIDDLAHAYPRELNPALLAWMDQTPGKAG